MPPGPTLDGEARLGTSESDQVRWTLINAGPIALGESQSADTVKGGIARAPACCHLCVHTEPKDGQQLLALARGGPFRGAVEYGVKHA